MFTVTIDDVAVELKEIPKNMGDLFNIIKNDIADDKIIVQIFLNDVDVFNKDHDELRKDDLKGEETIKVVTATLNSQVLSHVQALVKFFIEMRPVMRQASRELRYGAVPTASTKLAECFEGLETVIRLVNELTPVLPKVDAALSNDEIAIFAQNPEKILISLINDFETGDWMALADRLEFQLDPLMGRWQMAMNRVLQSLKTKQVES